MKWLVLTLVLLLAGCASPDGNDAGDAAGDGAGNGAGAGEGSACGSSAAPSYAVGDFWDYDSHISGSYDASGNSHDEVTSAGDDVVITGYSEMSGARADTEKTLCADGLAVKSVTVSNSYTGDITTTFDPACNGIHFPVVVGDSYSETCTATVSTGNSFQVVNQYDVVAEESVTVPAGTFDAFRIDITSSQDGNEVTQTLWYAEEACTAVKMETTQQGTTALLELSDYQC